MGKGLTPNELAFILGDYYVCANFAITHADEYSYLLTYLH